MSPLLDVAMIVRDEEAHLPACLASLDALRPILGRLHVYDTGSTDRTVEIARAWGAVVTEGFWDDDFARARNASLEPGSAPWILWTDADDLLQVDVAALARRLAEELPGEAAAFGSQLRVDGADGKIVTTSIRVIRRGATRFVNRVHERVVTTAGDPPPCASLAPEVLTTIHTGYTQAAQAGKVNRNLALLDREVVEARRIGGPRLAEVLWNRGRTLAGASRYDDAIVDLVEARTLGGLREFRLEAGERLAILYLECERYDECEVLLQELRHEGQDPQMTAWLWARLALARGQAREALTLLRTIDKPRSGSGTVDSWVPVLALRARAAAIAGEYDEALAAALPLMAKHGGGAGLGPLVMALWGARPDETLVGLLAEFGPAHAASVAVELGSAGERGHAIAERYLARLGLTSAAGDPDSARTASAPEGAVHV